MEVEEEQEWSWSVQSLCWRLLWLHGGTEQCGTGALQPTPLSLWEEGLTILRLLLSY